MNETYLGQSGWLWLVFGLLVSTPAGVGVDRRSTRARDQRTGADMVPMSRRALAIFIGLPLAPIVSSWGVIEIFDTRI